MDAAWNFTKRYKAGVELIPLFSFMRSYVPSTQRSVCDLSIDVVIICLA